MTRTLKLLFLVAAGAILVLAAVAAYRPARIVGMDGDALGRSVARELRFSNPDNPTGVCRQAADVWECTIINSSDAPVDSATVRTDADGCWSAARGGFSGCVTLIDYLATL